MGQKRFLAGQSEEEIVAACRNNDHEAFAELVDRYKHRVHWLVRRMLSGTEVEDLTQEVFLRVYQALPGFRGESKLSTWIYRITRNLCLLELRRQRRHGEHISLDDPDEKMTHTLLRESQEDLEQQLEKQDLSQCVQELISQLPAHYRTVLTLFYSNQVSYEEIGEIMEIPLGTVKTYIHRARLKLRELLLAQSDLEGFTYVPRTKTVGRGD